MVEAATASMAGGLTGGVTAPISTAINEISEVFQQLNKPTWTRTYYERDKYGNLLLEETWTVSKLDVILLIGGPVCVVLVIAMLERMAETGGAITSWFNENYPGVLEATTSPVLSLVKEAVDENDETSFVDVIKRMWGLVGPTFL